MSTVYCYCETVMLRSCKQFYEFTPYLPEILIQLTGVAAIAIAAKKEESDPPRLDELAALTAGTCPVASIRDRELDMLKVSPEVTTLNADND